MEAPPWVSSFHYPNHKNNAYKKEGSYPNSCPLFGEGIFLLMGCSKNYIMYWGGLPLLL
jgi:hypothetical protein